MAVRKCSIRTDTTFDNWQSMTKIIWCSYLVSKPQFKKYTLYSIFGTQIPSNRTRIIMEHFNFGFGFALKSDLELNNFILFFPMYQPIWNRRQTTMEITKLKLLCMCASERKKVRYRVERDVGTQFNGEQFQSSWCE